MTYSKFGNFFCDCGAKEDGACEALVRRSPQAIGNDRDEKPGNEDVNEVRFRRPSSPHRERSHRRGHEDAKRTLRNVLTSQLGQSHCN